MGSAHGANCWSPFPPPLTPPLHPPAHSYLQQLVEVLDATFLNLLCRDLRLFEMDVLVVKCLRGEEKALRGQVLTPALFDVACEKDFVQKNAC